MVSKWLESFQRRNRSRKLRLTARIDRIVDRVYFKDRDIVEPRKRKIYFYCVVFGSYWDLFFSYTLPSLLQQGNIPALAACGHEMEMTIYTRDGERENILEQYESRLALVKEYMPVNIISFGDPGRSRLLINAGLAQIQRCIDEDAMMFLTDPDIIFGNHSISNAVKLTEGKDVCMAAAHPRVSRESVLASETFSGLKRMDRTIENDELVDLAFQHGHQQLLNSFDNTDYNCTRATALSVRPINGNTYSVIHNSPTVFLASFIKDDLRFFRQSGRWNFWDNRWPRLLLRQNRVKIVGSSDVFFCVELTENGQALAEMEEGQLNNDQFLTRSARFSYHYVYNTFCSVWTGRKAGPEKESAGNISEAN